MRAFKSCFVVRGQRRTDTVHFDAKARRGIADERAEREKAKEEKTERRKEKYIGSSPTRC